MGRGDAITVGYGPSVDAIETESLLGVLGRLAGRASICTAAGMAAVDEGADYYVITSCAAETQAPTVASSTPPPTATCGRSSTGASAAIPRSSPTPASKLSVRSSNLAPEERWILLPLIETLGSSGADFTGTTLTVAAGLRPRTSELEKGDGV